MDRRHPSSQKRHVSATLCRSATLRPSTTSQRCTACCLWDRRICPWKGHQIYKIRSIYFDSYWIHVYIYIHTYTQMFLAFLLFLWRPWCTVAINLVEALLQKIRSEAYIFALQMQRDWRDWRDWRFRILIDFIELFTVLFTYFSHTLVTYLL